MRYFEDLQVMDEPVTSEEEYQIEADEIIDFAKRWDPLPFHIDEEAGRRSVAGSLFASGMHSIVITSRLMHRMVGEPTAVVAGLGWDEVRFRIPVRPGDRLRARAQVIEKRRSKSNPRRGIVRYQVELLNQNDELALSFINATLVQCRDDDEKDE